MMFTSPSTETNIKSRPRIIECSFGEGWRHKFEGGGGNALKGGADNRVKILKFGNEGVHEPPPPRFYGGATSGLGGVLGTALDRSLGLLGPEADENVTADSYCMR